MKLQEIMDQGYTLKAWTLSAPRGERRVVLKLSKKIAHDVKFYVAHSPQLDTAIKEVEFTEPVLLR